MTAWGKADEESGDWHHLAHHSADVAATFIALLDLPTFRDRAECAAGRSLTVQDIECLGALAFRNCPGCRWRFSAASNRLGGAHSGFLIEDFMSRSGHVWRTHPYQRTC